LRRSDAREEKGCNDCRTGALNNLIKDSKPSRNLLACGLIAGMAVATLNFSAAVHDWPLQDYFDILDSLIISPRHAAEYRFRLLYAKGADMNPFDPMFTMLCYWSVIGVFLAFLFHLIRFNDVPRSWFYALLLGSSLGFVAGILNVSAILNQWKLQNFFHVADAPLISLFDIHTGRIGPPILPRPLYSLLAMICYWTAIGLILASLFCVARIFKRRMKPNEGSIMPRKNS
jgi:hypothetical protein